MGSVVSSPSRQCTLTVDCCASNPGSTATRTSVGATYDSDSDAGAFGDLAATDDCGTQRVGRALRALYDGYHVQGDTPLRRTRRGGPWAPALLLAAYATPMPGVLDARLSAPSTPFHDARARQWFDLPMEDDRYGTDAPIEAHNGSTVGYPVAFAPLAADLFEALLSSLPSEFVTDNAKPFVDLPLEEVVDPAVSDERDAASMRFGNASDPTLLIDAGPGVEETSSDVVRVSTSALWTNASASDETTPFSDRVDTAAYDAFDDAVDGMSAEEDYADVEKDLLYDEEAQEGYEDIEDDIEMQIDDPIEQNMRALWQLAMHSESGPIFEAAAARVPAMRCTLLAGYTLSHEALGQVASLSVARRYVARDTVRPITFADLESAIDEARETPRNLSTTTPATLTTTFNDTVTGPDDEPQPANSTDSSLSACSAALTTMASDLSSRQTLFDLIRSDVRQGVGLLRDAIADLQRHRARPHRDERDTIWPSTAHFAGAALAAFRQAGLAVEDAGSGTHQPFQQWADVAMAIMHGEAREVRDLPQDRDRSITSLARDLGNRFAATLLILRFSRDHWSSLDDDNLFDQLLTVMALWQLDTHWDRSDSLPTVSAMRRYALRLIDADNAARRTVQTMTFLPMTYYRVRCYVDARGQARRKRSLYLWPLQVRLRDPVYQACFIRTDAASESAYHGQFSDYRADTVRLHAHYVAEALLTGAAAHPLVWRQATQVYDVQYERRLKKLGGFLLYIGPAKRYWYGRIVTLVTLVQPIRWMVCQAEDSEVMPTVARIDETGGCQSRLDGWTGMQHFALTALLGQASQDGRFDTGWLPHAPSLGALLEQRLTMSLRREPVDTDDAATAPDGSASQAGQGRAATSDLFAETAALTEEALRRDAATFEREAYTPASAERFMRLLPFYGAIGKEWDKDTYRVNWGHLARDAAEVMLLLVSLGIPAQAAGSAALRVGSAALRAARSARLPPMARAIQVLRAALPYLGGVSRALGRRGGARLAAGLRRRSTGAWRSLRRFYWGRTSSWHLERRVRAGPLSPAPLHHFDQLYISHVQTVFQRHARMRELIEAPAGMCYDAAELGRGLLHAFTDRVMYRGVLIWRQGSAQPANHIVMVVRRGPRTYVLDPTAGQFKRFSAGLEGPVYLPDAQWRALYRHGFYDEVVKFADFRTLAQTERLFGVVPRTVAEPLQSAQTLVSPAWYLARSG